MSARFPWHEAADTQLKSAYLHDRLAHAVLISGGAGTGIDEFVRDFAHWALCAGADMELRPCQHCRGCELVAAGNHPDLKIVEPGEDGRQIAIDQIREVIAYYTLKSHYGRNKIVIISPADRMNTSAANALLKILEEPPEGAILLLAVNQIRDVPMTIRSRCIRIACDQVDRAAGLGWLRDAVPDLTDTTAASVLAQSAGAPLFARELALHGEGDMEAQLIAHIATMTARQTIPEAPSGKLGELPVARLCDLMIGVVSRLVLAKYSLPRYYENPAALTDDDLQGVANHLNLKRLYALLDLLFETKTALRRHSGLREVDIADSLWIGLAGAAGRGGVEHGRQR